MRPQMRQSPRSAASCNISMLEWEEPTSRYRLHDLMRDFARQRLAPDESNSVARRHSAHYLAVLQSANDFYREGGQSMMRGLALYDLELRNVQAGQAWAAANAAEGERRSEIVQRLSRSGAPTSSACVSIPASRFAGARLRSTPPAR